ncbi:MAG: UDP-glucose 4-epimerase GalE [Spirochaetota bacterium]
MKVLVTGGAGYIGSHVVHELNKNGYQVLVVDTLEKGDEANLFSTNEFLQGDIGEDSILEKAFAFAPEAVFHFAAWKGAGESMQLPEKYSLNNLNGTMKLISKMSQESCRFMIFSSSAAVYGTPNYLPLDENHTLQPINYYGYTKLSVEENLKWYEQLKGMRYAALRYFNAAGYDPEGKVTGLEKTPANLLPIIMEAAAGIREGFQLFGDDYETPDGTCIRDYIHVTDLARAHVLSMKYIMEQNSSLIVNLGSENGYSVKEIIDAAEKVIGNKIPHSVIGRRAGDPAELRASSAKARELLRWTPEYSDAETIVRTTWEVYKKRLG